LVPDHRIRSQAELVASKTELVAKVDVVARAQLAVEAADLAHRLGDEAGVGSHDVRQGQRRQVVQPALAVNHGDRVPLRPGAGVVLADEATDGRQLAGGEPSVSFPPISILVVFSLSWLGFQAGSG